MLYVIYILYVIYVIYVIYILYVYIYIYVKPKLLVALLEEDAFIKKDKLQEN